MLTAFPPLRGGVSPSSKDSAVAWRDCLQAQTDSRWANAGTRKVDGEELSNLIRRKLAAITLPEADRGAEFLATDLTVDYEPSWFCDSRIGGVCNHTSRAHMKTDLFRIVVGSFAAP